MVQDEHHWQAVLARDPSADGTFIYAVRSTGVYCRPSCPSRRPRRENVQFFASPAAAEAASFRPCKRCRPEAMASEAPSHLGLIRHVCHYIEAHADEALSLGGLSAEFHMSPAHLQRVFKRLMGITPRQYAEACRLHQFKTQLKSGADVTTAQNAAGYSSSSRVYERTPIQLGMTPAAYRRGGATHEIRYAIVQCQLGRLLVAMTNRGICAIRLGDDDGQLTATLAQEYPRAAITPDAEGLIPWMTTLLRHLEGAEPHLDLPLDIQATAFQWRVWEALRAIPYGETRSYHAIAQAIGEPSAVRAVANACAANPVALAIPCHRVVRSNGDLGGYRWGMDRKQKLLQQEAKKVSS